MQNPVQLRTGNGAGPRPGRSRPGLAEPARGDEGRHPGGRPGGGPMRAAGSSVSRCKPRISRWYGTGPSPVQTQSQPAKTQAGHKPTAGSWPARCSTSAAPFGKLLATAKPYSSPARPRAGTPDSRVVPEPGTVLGAFCLHPGESGRFRLSRLLRHPRQELATRNPMLLFSFVGLLLLRLDDGQVVRVVVRTTRHATHATNRRVGPGCPSSYRPASTERRSP